MRSHGSSNRAVNVQDSNDLPTLLTHIASVISTSTTRFRSWLAEPIPDVGVNDGISERRDPDGIGIPPHANVHDSRAPSRFNVADRSAAGATLAVNEECAECVMEPEALGAMMKDMVVTLDPSITSVEVDAAS